MTAIALDVRRAVETLPIRRKGSATGNVDKNTSKKMPTCRAGHHDKSHLGPDTADVVQAIQTFDPEEDWAKVEAK